MAPIRIYPPADPRLEDETPNGVEPNYTSTTTSCIRQLEAARQTQRAYLEEAALYREKDVGAGELSDADMVRQLLTHRFGNCVRGWRCALDPNYRFQVSLGEFAATMRKLGFAGDAKAAWVGLGGTETGMIRLANIDEDGARKLKALHVALAEIGESLKAICEKKECLRITLEEFAETCKKLKKTVKKPAEVFKLLPNGGNSSAYVTVDDAEWLDHFAVPPKTFETKAGPRRSSTGALESRTRAATERRALWEMSRENFQEKSDRPPSRSRAVETMQLMLHHKHGSVCRAWWDDIDKHKMCVLSKHEFLTAIERIGYKGDLDKLWHGIMGGTGKEAKDKGVTVSDLDGPDAGDVSGSEDDPEKDLISLDNLEPRAPAALKSFHERCCERYGSMDYAFQKLEAKEKPLISNMEFFDWCRLICLRENPELLWAYLDHGDKGVISLEVLDKAAARKVYSEDRLEWAQNEVDEKLKVARPKRRIPIMERAHTPSGERPDFEEYRSRDDFIKLLEKKYGSVIRAWRRVLDADGNGSLSRSEFFLNVRSVGFKGNIEELWRQFELDLSGSLSLEDLHPESQKECEDFYDCVFNSLGGLDKAFQSADNDGNNALKFQEFLSLCLQVGFKGNALRLWNHLDVDGSGQLSYEEVQFLERIATGDMSEILAEETQRRNHKRACAREAEADERDTKKFVKVHKQMKAQVMAQKTGEKLRTEFLETLSRRYGSVVKAWHKCLDINKKGQVRYQDFKKNVRGIVGKDHEGQAKIDELWKLLRRPNRDDLFLDDLDPLAHTEVEKFKQQCLDRYGALEKAFRAIDRDGSGKVSYAEFKEWCADIKFAGSERRLFDFLDSDGSGSIGLEEIDAETAKKQRQVAKGIDFRNETIASRENKQQGQRQLAEMREAWAKQRFLDIGAKNLGDFRQLLIRRFGSIVKAWRKGLAPDGTKLGFVKFCSGCRAIGYAGALEELWESFGCDDKKPLSLEILEPGIEKDLNEFREKMLDRFGSIKAAFDFIDQDGSMSVDLAEFCKACNEVQFIGNYRRLFEYLDSDDSGSVSLAEVDQDAASILTSERKKKDKERRALQKDAEIEAKLWKKKLAEEDKADIGAKSRSGFLKLLERKFGSILRAWRKVDSDGNGRLSYNEFCGACRALGYAGNVKVLWMELDSDGSGHISIKELDSKGARLIDSFVSGCQKRLGGLRKAFGPDGTLRLRKDDFQNLCATIGIKEKGAWEKLFGFFDHLDHQSIIFEDVRFLEDGAQKKKKVDAQWMRDGPLHLRLRPRPVGFKKSRSLPSLKVEHKSQKIKDAWNTRHHVLDTKANKDDQLMWFVNHVKQREPPALEGHWSEWTFGDTV
eukprot:gnl/MRDRNA2_/MRDRNA2_48898_c0_seq1.p1 gnl/MRDRNA2_/MRDRNA2_48898_c0~~gnl/MRDRNA2_/MRDRNA2_48898_c0_seq1.p1  ORF type:complete len:1345 (+),score=318.81 gnl/MRDRNA2_/MRDRNA2_48898_c0_seq1:55-4089(+)